MAREFHPAAFRADAVEYPALSKLSEQEKNDLLRWFWHYLSPDQRHAIGTIFPLHYNKLCGRDVVTVHFPDEAPVRLFPGGDAA